MLVGTFYKDFLKKKSAKNRETYKTDKDFLKKSLQKVRDKEGFGDFSQVMQKSFRSETF